MTDEAQPAPLQESESKQVQETSDSTSATAETLAVNSDKKTDIDVDLLLREREEARREAQKLRATLRKKEESEAEAAKASLSEAERLAAELDELRKARQDWQTEKREMLAEGVARDVAESLGLIDYKDALALIPRSSIEYDDNGVPVNLRELFQHLVKSKPYLVAGSGQSTKVVSTNAASGTSGGSAPVLTAMELEAAQRAGISPERWNALKSVKTLDDWKKTKTS